MKYRFSNRSTILIILAVFIPLLSAAVLLSYREKTVFQGDEPGWISSGLYYADLLFKGDFEWTKWHQEGLGPWGPMNPHLGKLVIGVPLRLHFPDQSFSHLYDFNKTYKENEKEGNIPPRKILLFSRAVSAVLGGLCCLLVFLIGVKCCNLWVGTIAAVLLLGNPLFFTFSTQAMTDISYNFFMISVALFGFRLLQNTAKRPLLYGSLLLGILSGLACSVKITGIIIGGLFFVTLLLYLSVIHKKRNDSFSGRL